MSESLRDRFKLTDDDRKLGLAAMFVLALKEKMEERKEKKKRGEDLLFDLDF